MRDVLLSIQEKLANQVGDLKYIDEDWGQLDDYGQHPPTQFPLALIDIGTVQYSDVGRDQTATPVNRQQATATITVSIADIKLTNSSFRAPKQQKQNAWEIWDLVQNVHAQLHGYRPIETTGVLMRTNMRKMKRDDGIQEYEVTYSLGLNNV